MEATVSMCCECGSRLRASNVTGRCGACSFHYQSADSEAADFWLDYRERIGPASASHARQLAVEEYVLGAAQIMVSRVTGTLLGRPVPRIRAACEIHEMTIAEAWERLRRRGYVTEITEEEWVVIPHMPEGMIEERRRYGVDDWSPSDGEPDEDPTSGLHDLPGRGER